MHSIATQTPMLSVQNVIDPDGDALTYEFEVFPNSYLTPPTLTSINEVPEGTTHTSWQCDVTLEEDTWYYWQVRATDGVACSDWVYGSFFVGTMDISVEMNLPKGWSMISLPVKPDNAKLSVLFPEAAVVFCYKKEAGYVRVTKEDDLDVG